MHFMIIDSTTAIFMHWNYKINAIKIPLIKVSNDTSWEGLNKKKSRTYDYSTKFKSALFEWKKRREET